MIQTRWTFHRLQQPSKSRQRKISISQSYWKPEIPSGMQNFRWCTIFLLHDRISTKNTWNLRGLRQITPSCSSVQKHILEREVERNSTTWWHTDILENIDILENVLNRNSTLNLLSVSCQREAEGALRLPTTFGNYCYRQEEVKDSLRLLATYWQLRTCLGEVRSLQNFRLHTDNHSSFLKISETILTSPKNMLAMPDMPGASAEWRSHWRLAMAPGGPLRRVARHLWQWITSMCLCDHGCWQHQHWFQNTILVDISTSQK